MGGEYKRLLNYFVIDVIGSWKDARGQNRTHAILEILTSYRRRRTTTHTHYPTTHATSDA